MNFESKLFFHLIKNWQHSNSDLIILPQSFSYHDPKFQALPWSTYIPSKYSLLFQLIVEIVNDKNRVIINPSKFFRIHFNTALWIILITFYVHKFTENNILLNFLPKMYKYVKYPNNVNRQTKPGIYFQADFHFSRYNYVIVRTFNVLGSTHVPITCVHVDT